MSTRPHQMALPLDPPCPACGGHWQRPAFNFDRLDADGGCEVFQVCAKCRREVAAAPTAGAAHPNRETIDHE